MPFGSVLLWKGVAVVLVNVSRRGSSQWSEDQRRAWGVIIDVPFPVVDPRLDEEGVLRGPVAEITRRLAEIALEYPGRLYLHMAGEYFTVISTLDYLRNSQPEKWVLVWPTSARRVEEKVLPDGGTKQVVVFDFVRWRFAPSW